MMTDTELLEALRTAARPRHQDDDPGLRVEEIRAATAQAPETIRGLLRRAVEAGTVVCGKRSHRRLDGVTTRVPVYRPAP